MERGKDLILVTGATGNQGGAVARELLGNGHRVRAMTRNPEGASAQELASLGAEVVRGDFDDESSLEQALDGAWGAYSVQNTWEAGVVKEEEQGKRFADVAKRKGIQHFIYGSVGSAHRNTGIPHFDNKWRVEQRVRELGFPSHAVIRPVFYMENWTFPWFKPAIDEGKLAIGIRPDTKLQMIAVEDIGKYGRIVFEQHDELNGAAIDIAGDELDPIETAEILSRVTGRTIEHVQVPIEEVRKFSEDFALMLEWFDRDGYDADLEGNTRKYGIAPTRFEEWAGSVTW